MASLIKVTLTRGISKCTDRQVATVRGLGLGKVGSTKILKDSAPIRGMILKVQHLIEVERFDGDDSLRHSARLDEQRASQGA
jgi:large subunit ribosomal protein L30